MKHTPYLHNLFVNLQKKTNRRYDWIEYENGRNLGKSGTCSYSTRKVIYITNLKLLFKINNDIYLGQNHINCDYKYEFKLCLL